MSDGITDCARDARRAELEKVNHGLIIDKAKRAHIELREAVGTLRELGYTVEYDATKIKIYKEY